AGQHEQGGGGEQGGHVAAVPGEPRVETEAGGLGLEVVGEGAFPRDDEERLGPEVPPPGRRLQQGAEPLLRGQPPGGEYEGAASSRAAGQVQGFGSGLDGSSGSSGGDQRAADPAGARRAHALLEVRRDAEHRVGAARHDPLEHAVDRAAGAAGRRCVVHGHDQRGPGLVDGGPDERQGDRGEGAGPQAVGVDHVRPPGGGQPAQPPDRPQVVAPARAVRDLDRGELDAGDGAEAEVLVGPGGAAGAGAEDERDLHRLITFRPTARRSPPSATATTARNAASTAALAASVTPTLGRKPAGRRAADTPIPAAAPASAPPRPARVDRPQPRSASGPRNRRTRMSRATPEPVSPMVVPAPSHGTTAERGTNGTISRSAAITATQPPLTASAEARLRPSA